MNHRCQSDRYREIFIGDARQHASIIINFITHKSDPQAIWLYIYVSNCKYMLSRPLSKRNIERQELKIRKRLCQIEIKKYMKYFNISVSKSEFEELLL